MMVMIWLWLSNLSSAIEVVVTTNPTGTAEYQFELSGGRTCLDFANTLTEERHGERRERLAGYADLLAWARQSGAIDAGHARRLLAEARRRPADAEAVHREAIDLREALFRAFSALAERREPPDRDVDALSSFLGRALAHRRLVRGEGGFMLGWDDAAGALDAPLWRVAWSASELLTSRPDLERVRVCGLHETHECSWLFMDATRGRTRRWCSMTSCGNRAKARRHYARSRSGDPR
jgi:predicted RNA-binding Zn ribbon-like protein